MTKAALVTGAGDRLGRAMAVRLGALGYAVAVHYAHSEAGAAETVSLIEAAGGKAVALQADLLDMDQSEVLVDRAAEALGAPLTCLINNASIFEHNMLDQRVRKLTPEFMTYTIAAMTPHVRVNGIGPGPTLKGGRQSEEHFDAQRKATISGRGSNPEDIVGAMEFILKSPALTGQLLCIDGGQHLGWMTPDVLGVE